MTGESTFRDRISENVTAKRLIAKAASTLVSPGETIFIDTGSTTLIFAEEIADIGNLTVITNSSKIAEVISAHNNASCVFLVGGNFDADNRETYGPLAHAQLRSFQAHHAVLTIGALDATGGAMDYNIDEAQVARVMVEQAQALIVLADASKFNRIASFKVCALGQITHLVCETLPGPELAGALARNEVQVVCNAA
jgi:DeoR family glycerol-3-phosphate regulon repressor